MLPAVVLGALLIYAPRGNPMFKGRPLRFWLQGWGPFAGMVMNPGTPYEIAYPTASDAQMALQNSGAKSLPALLRMLRANDYGLTWKIEYWCAKHRLLTQDIDPTIQRMTATVALRMSNSGAARVVPQLIAIYEGYKRPADLGMYIPTIFTSIGPGAIDAVPALSHALTNEVKAEARQCAAEALGAIHSQPKIAVPALLLALRDSSPDVQAQAALSLGEFRTNAETALPTLRILAQQPGPRRRGSHQSWDLGNVSSYSPAAAAEDAIEMIAPQSKHPAHSPH